MAVLKGFFSVFANLKKQLITVLLAQILLSNILRTFASLFTRAASSDHAIACVTGVFHTKDGYNPSSQFLN